MNDPNELYHFGVKGMHWGVRRTPEELGRADYSKTVKKLRKYGKKIERNNRRSAKYAFKSSKYKLKAQKAWTDKGFVRKTKKSAKFEYKANKAKMKANRLETKGQNKAKKLVEKYKDLPADTIDTEQLAYVQRWIDKSWT